MFIVAPLPQSRQRSLSGLSFRTAYFDLPKSSKRGCWEKGRGTVCECTEGVSFLIEFTVGNPYLFLEI